MLGKIAENDISISVLTKAISKSPSESMFLELVLFCVFTLKLGSLSDFKMKYPKEPYNRQRKHAQDGITGPAMNSH